MEMINNLFMLPSLATTKCTPMTTRSFGLAWLRGHREPLAHPRLPGRFIALDGGLRVGAVEIDSHVRLNHPAAGKDADVRSPGHGRVETKQHGFGVHPVSQRHAGHAREAVGSAPLLPFGNLEEPQLPAQFLPRLRLRIAGEADELHRRTLHAL